MYGYAIRPRQKATKRPKGRSKRQGIQKIKTDQRTIVPKKETEKIAFHFLELKIKQE